MHCKSRSPCVTFQLEPLFSVHMHGQLIWSTPISSCEVMCVFLEGLLCVAGLAPQSVEAPCAFRIPKCLTLEHTEQFLLEVLLPEHLVQSNPKSSFSLPGSPPSLLIDFNQHNVWDDFFSVTQKLPFHAHRVALGCRRQGPAGFFDTPISCDPRPLHLWSFRTLN